MASYITGAAAAPEHRDAHFETSAAWAQAEASTKGIADQTSRNAIQMQNAAADAANHAQFKEPVPAVNQLEAGLSSKTNAATAQGRLDVQSAEATAAALFDQAKKLAGKAAETAKSYMPGSQSDGIITTGTEGGFVSCLQSTATLAIGTGKEYLSSAQTMAQPHIDHALDVITGSDSSAPSEVPASTAPLESGNHVVNTPYPHTTTGQSTKVG